MDQAKTSVRDYRAQSHRWLGQSWPRLIYYSPDAPSASDAPVAEPPGHRRDNVILESQALVRGSAPATAALELLDVR